MKSNNASGIGYQAKKKERKRKKVKPRRASPSDMFFTRSPGGPTYRLSIFYQIGLHGKGYKSNSRYQRG
jgi:hypothetical protein